ncbi:MAG: 4-hydroxy-tetrahydrodipicolinate reductase [Tissierellia bacterium]|nr:4-hydroxy-tetrahydrodipicolinate reductase [Tissierellia bacterium]
MINIAIAGINGAMGQVLAGLVENDENLNLVCGISRSANQKIKTYESFDDIKEDVDVIIDFSSPDLLDSMLDYAKRTNTKLVIATTGYSEEQEEKIERISEEIAILKAGNMSLGVNVLKQITTQLSSLLKDFDIEIVEAHHNLKKDAPSGTAKMLFDAVKKDRKDAKAVYDRHDFSKKREKNEVGISSIRAGSIVGEHEIYFAGVDEVVKISHQALSKKIFAKGAIEAAKFIINKEKGLYDMDDCLRS